MTRQKAPGRRRSGREDGAAAKRRRDQKVRDDLARTKLLAKYADTDPNGLVVCHFSTHVEAKLSDGTTQMCLLSPKVHKLLGVSVGDMIWTEAIGDERIVVARAPRNTEVRRKRGDEDRTGHVIAANVDQMAITVALHEPPLRTGAIDRYLVLASIVGLEPLLVITKIDQVSEEDPQWEELDPYLEMDLPIVLTSATTGAGIDDLQAALDDKVTVFAGHSGVGKSSLVQALGLDGALKAGDMSRSHGRVRGRHTTSVARLHELHSGGWVVDTPGVRAIGLVDLEREDARVHFPDFEPFAEKCAFANCLHVEEDGCAVFAAAEAGELSDARYLSYVRLIDSLEPE
jgi:ribosome biogenesis GTPase / thiamine phosphate phosphatase